MDYFQVIGNGKKVCFCKDNWLGSSSLAIQFQELYRIANEKNGTTTDLWDGVNLKCTFRRCVDDRLLEMWNEVCQLASTIVFNEEERFFVVEV